MKKRLDEMLTESGLVASRSRAKDLVTRGLVFVDGLCTHKPSAQISPRARLTISPEAGAQYVSRGALKLKAALDQYGFNPNGLNILDVGASAGGFTEVLLERGASKVFAVDVGHGQLHERLRLNEQVISLEGQDIRRLNPLMFSDPLEGITVDVSFISLTKVLPNIFRLVAQKCWLVALIKPQFEVGRDMISKGGLVKDCAEIQRAILAIKEYFELSEGWVVTKVISSPIRGGSGNHEFLIGAHRDR